MNRPGLKGGDHSGDPIGVGGIDLVVATST